MFGKKALTNLQRKYNRATAENEEARAALEDARRRLDVESSARKDAEDRCAALEKKIAAAEKDRDKLRESLARAEQMVKWMEDREEAGKEAVRKAEAAQKEAIRKTAEANADLERLRAELDEAKRPKIEATVETTVEATSAPESPPPETGSKDELTRLRDENESLRRLRAENAERLRVALRKAEHNRRAYLITQMQLDLAEDRIHILTKGSPRPVHRKEPAPDAAPGEKVVAEDVEGYEETEHTGG